MSRYVIFHLLFLLMLIFVGCGEQKESSSKPNAVQDSQLMRGQEVYLQVCAACHASGLAGAPKFGDKEAWAPRIAQGMDQLVESAVKGKGGMPARGGQAGLGDREIRAAVLYIVSKSR